MELRDTFGASDSSINLEILEQLRSLGEEIRNDRYKKEQKQFIKQVVNKELSKSWIRSKYVPDNLPTLDPSNQSSQDNADSIEETNQTNEEPVYIEEPAFWSRIRR